MSRDIKYLYKPLQPLVKAFLERVQKEVCGKKYKVIITSGYRNNKEQDILYSIGRRVSENPERIVTYVRGGYSMHNYGLAIDIGFVKPNKMMSWDISLFLSAGHIATEMGFEWGYNLWREKGFYDYPHFQYTDGLSLKDIRNGKRPKIGEYDIDFAEKHSGKIFIAVEDKGKAYYVNTKTKQAEYMGKTPKEMLDYVQRNSVHVGINNKDLKKLLK